MEIVYLFVSPKEGNISLLELLSRTIVGRPDQTPGCQKRYEENGEVECARRSEWWSWRSGCVIRGAEAMCGVERESHGKARMAAGESSQRSDVIRVIVMASWQICVAKTSGAGWTTRPVRVQVAS